MLKRYGYENYFSYNKTKNDSLALNFPQHSQTYFKNKTHCIFFCYLFVILEANTRTFLHAWISIISAY